MATTLSARQALLSGEWREAKDAQGKAYYFNKKLNRTVWDLDKEMQQGNSRGGPTIGNSSNSPQRIANSNPMPSSSPQTQPQTRDFGVMAKELVDSGIWCAKTSTTGGGATFYQHSESGATTRDLALYLEISSAVAQSEHSMPVRGVPAAPGQVELRSKKGELLDANELIGDVDPWVTLFLSRDRGGEHEIASRRLLKQILERTGQWESWNHAERRAEVLQQDVKKLTAELDARNELIVTQQRELDDLRRMLYFGVQGMQLGNGKHHGNASSPHDLPQVPIPAAPRDIAARLSGQSDERISVLESLVQSLQAQNRVLAEELESVNGRSHRAVSCATCVQLDPWRRLMEGAMGRPQTSSPTTPSAAEPDFVAYPRSAGVPTSYLHLGNDQRRDMHGIGVLPKSLQSPTTKKCRPSSGPLNPQASTAVAASVTRGAAGVHSLEQTPLRISMGAPNAIMPLSTALRIHR